MNATSPPRVGPGVDQPIDPGAVASHSAPSMGSDSGDLSVMFPGKRVDLPGPDGSTAMTVIVTPLGIVHMQKFIDCIQEIVPKLSSQMDITKLFKVGKGGEEGMGFTQKLMPIVVPMLTSDIIGIIDECVQGLDLKKSKNAPHWWLPRIVEAWIVESFGDEMKLRPWVEAVDNVLSRATGESLGLWETLSRSSSGQATTSE